MWRSLTLLTHPIPIFLPPPLVQATKTALQPVTDALGPPLALAGQALRVAGGQAWEALAGVHGCGTATLPPTLPSLLAGDTGFACRPHRTSHALALPCPRLCRLTAACACLPPPAAVGMTLAAFVQAGLAPIATVLLEVWVALGAAMLPLFQVRAAELALEDVAHA